MDTVGGFKAEKILCQNIVELCILQKVLTLMSDFYLKSQDEKTSLWFYCVCFRGYSEFPIYPQFGSR